MGDFNLLSSTRDKNNGRINRALVTRFQKAIDHLQIRELNLMGNFLPGPTTMLLQ
jgi:hypothetical protein